MDNKKEVDGGRLSTQRYRRHTRVSIARAKAFGSQCAGCAGQHISPSLSFGFLLAAMRRQWQCTKSWQRNVDGCVDAGRHLAVLKRTDLGVGSEIDLLVNDGSSL